MTTKLIHLDGGGNPITEVASGIIEPNEIRRFGLLNTGDYTLKGIVLTSNSGILAYSKRGWNFKNRLKIGDIPVGKKVFYYIQYPSLPGPGAAITMVYEETSPIGLYSSR